MKKNIKVLISFIAIIGFITGTSQNAYSFDWNFFKKKDSSKEESLEKNTSVKSKRVKKQKYDDEVVIAKTDKLQPSVRIIVKGETPEVIDNQGQVIKKTLTSDSDNVNSVEKQHSNNDNKTSEMIDLDKNTVNSNKSKELADENSDVFNSPMKYEASVTTTHVISVDDCVKIALENNPTILSQLLSKDIYKSQIAQAWSNYFPTLNASLSYSKNDMMFTNFRFPMQRYNLWHVPNIGFNQLLFDFGKTSAQAGVARKTYEASRETLQSSINDVVFQVKNAYFNQLFLQQQVAVYEDSVLQFQVHLEQAKAYYDIGSKAKIDVSTAEYNLDNTKLTLVRAKNALETGFAQLTNAMGVPDFGKFDIQDRLDRRRYDITFDESFEIACNQNPNLQAAKKKMEGSKLLVKSTKYAFLPDLNAFGSAMKGGGRPNTDTGYQIGASLSYSNLNLLLLKKQVDEATLTYKKDQADYEAQRQKVYLDVKQAFIDLKNSQESIPVARASMEVAKERYELASGRYKVGLGDAIELKDSHIEYMNAKLQYYNTLMQYHISAANLEKVMGSPLEATDEDL